MHSCIIIKITGQVESERKKDYSAWSNLARVAPSILDLNGFVTDLGVAKDRECVNYEITPIEPEKVQADQTVPSPHSDR